MGFFGFSPSLKTKKSGVFLIFNFYLHETSLFQSSVTNVHSFHSDLRIDSTVSCGYLSSSAFIWKASSSQSSSLWVNSLTSCCWAKHRQTYNMTNYRIALETWRFQSQTAGFNCTYKQESPISQINAMSIICWYSLSSGYEMTALSGGVHRLLNFKGNLNASRPLSHRHQCHVVIQVNAYPTWLTLRGMTWLMNTEARRVASVNLCTDTG